MNAQNEINKNFYFDDSDLSIENVKAKKVIPKYFWELTAEEFYNTNPSFLKRMIYKLNNSRRAKQGIFYSSILLTSFLSARWLLKDYFEKIEKKHENYTVCKLQNWTNEYVIDPLNYIYRMMSGNEGAPIPNFEIKYRMQKLNSLNRKEVGIATDFIEEKIKEGDNSYIKVGENNLVQLVDFNKKPLSVDQTRSFPESILDFYVNKHPLYGITGVISFSYLSLYVTSKIYDWWITGKRPPIELLSPDKIKIDLNSIGGLFLVKDSFKDLITRVDKTRGKVSAGYVLHGGPGTGKTLSAQYLAKKLDWYFMYIESSTLLPTSESKYTVAGAVKYIFEKAKSLGKCVILFDEFDRLFVKNKEVIPEVLKLLDIYLKSENIIFIATTNNISEFDPALLRAGRLSNVIFVDNPSLKERRDIIDKLFKLRKLEISKEELLDYAAELTTGFSSALIVELVKKINDILIIDNFGIVTKNIFDKAYFSVVLGNKLINKPFEDKFLDKIARIKALELMYIENNIESYPNFIVFSTLYPYEKNYLNKQEFTGFDHKVNKFEVGNKININSMLTEVKSLMIKVVGEDLIYGSKSLQTEKDINKIRKIICDIVELENIYVSKVELSDREIKIFKEIYSEICIVAKNYLCDESFEKLVKTLKNNDIVSNDLIRKTLKK